MAAGVQITGLQKVIASLEDLQRRHKPISNVAVSYTADYALKIHEDLELHHENGMAKFLEIAARTTTKQVSEVIRKEIGEGKSMEEALLAGGQVVLDASNENVPVRTGFLRASGRTDII